ncbi:MAG: flagellar hook-associated protein FlgL [Myxococcota bacterium]
MRISDQHLYDFSMAQLSDARNSVDDLREEALTGRRVRKPSDDPVAANLGAREAAREMRVESNRRAVNNGVSSIQLADSALSQVGDVLVRLKELSVQFSNDTISADERDAAAAEVDEIRETILDMANTAHNGRYIFGGYLDSAPPFDAAGTYAGDGGIREHEVAPGVRLAAGLPGDEVFSAPGGTDVFQMVDDFRVALQANDLLGVRATIDQVDVAQEQISDSRARLGSQQYSFQMAGAFLDQTEEHAARRRDELIAADTTETYLKLNQAESALQAAVQIAAQLPLPGLLES